MAQYPDTLLGDDTIDPDFGGQPANVFGVPAFTWINSVLKFLSKAYLTYVRAPYATVVAVSQSAAAAGDIAVLVAGQVLNGGGYYVRKYTTGLSTPIVVGVYLEAVSAGAKARIAIAGVIPPTLTGLAAQSTPQRAGLDPAAGHVRVAQVGDTLLGWIDVQGQFLFNAHGVQTT